MVCYVASKNIDDLNSTLNKASENFYKWCCLNRLTLNLGKCKAMIICNCTRKKLKELRKSVAISINQVTLELVNEYKYLGIILDEPLKYNGHIKMIKQKVRQRAYLLKKVRNIVGHKEALTLYKSSILPFLDRGDIFFSSSDKQLLNSLQVLQNNCLRTVYGRRNWPGITQAHHESNLLLLKDRRDSHLLKLA